MHTGDMVFRAPSLSGNSGQVGKEQAPPCAEYLFSLYRIGLGHHDTTYLRGLCSFCAELLENNSPSQILSEVPGSYGIFGGGCATWIDAYETALALTSCQGPEMGMALWHASHDHHT